MSEKFWSLLLLVIVNLSAYTQTKVISPNKKLLKSTWEVYYQKVPVSGEIRVGLMAFENDEKIIPKSFFVKIPQHQESSLCVEISSRDGRYEANIPYDIKSLKSGVYEFELPTKHADELKKYTLKDITILAKIGESCTSNGSYYVLSTWNKPDLNTGQLHIYLNSDQPTFIQFESGGISRKITCERIEENASIAYNCSCVVPMNMLSNTTELNIQQRIRRVGKIYYSSYTFPIKL